MIVNTVDFSLPPLTEHQQSEWNTRVHEVAPLTWELYSDASGYQYTCPPKGLAWRVIALDAEAIPDHPAMPSVPSNPSGRQLFIIGSLFETDRHAPAAGCHIDCLNNVLMRYFLREDSIEAKTCAW